jgi:hypothetical protein
MTHASIPRLLLAALLANASVSQDQATTLLAVSRAADVVVVATVGAASDPSPAFHRRAFRRHQTLRGSIDPEFQLLEPAGACCGRSLFALVEGEAVLLFLRRMGPRLEPLGGSRGVVPARPVLIQHTLALLQANATALPAVLTAALATDEPRIADDAAHALAALPHLQLDAPARQQLLAALQQAASRSLTRLAPLAEAAVRDGSGSMFDALLPTYLAAADGQARLLRTALLRSDVPSLVDRLPLFDRPEHALRIAELLTVLPSAAASGAIRQMLARPCHPRAQLCLAEALLQRGAGGEALLTQLPRPVRELALQRRGTPPSFRSIRPGGQ